VALQAGEALPVKKLRSESLEKALTLLDDSLLPGTSDAVGRTNRRHRRMQKTICRVRTTEHVSQRIAADCLREARAEGRATTSAVLHPTRAQARSAPARVARRRKAAQP
jgi:hypothetical protein